MSRSALSIARTAKAAQSSSGEKQTAIAAPDVTEAAGSVGESVARASDRTRANTLRLWRIRFNSLLPCSRARHSLGPDIRSLPGGGLLPFSEARARQIRLTAITVREDIKKMR